MENHVQKAVSHQSADNRLRFVFSDKVVSFDAPADLTFGEIAGTLSHLPEWRLGGPLAIDVTVGRRLARRAS